MPPEQQPHIVLPETTNTSTLSSTSWLWLPVLLVGLQYFLYRAISLFFVLAQTLPFFQKVDLSILGLFRNLSTENVLLIYGVVSSLISFVVSFFVSLGVLRIFFLKRKITDQHFIIKSSLVYFVTVSLVWILGIVILLGSLFSLWGWLAFGGPFGAIVYGFVGLVWASSQIVLFIFFLKRRFSRNISSGSVPQVVFALSPVRLRRTVYVIESFFLSIMISYALFSMVAFYFVWSHSVEVKEAQKIIVEEKPKEPHYASHSYDRTEARGELAIQDFFAWHGIKFDVPEGADFVMYKSMKMYSNHVTLGGFTVQPEQKFRDSPPRYEIGFDDPLRSFNETYVGKNLTRMTLGGRNAVCNFQSKERLSSRSGGLALFSFTFEKVDNTHWYPAEVYCDIENGMSILEISFRGPDKAIPEFEKFLKSIVFTGNSIMPEKELNLITRERSGLGKDPGYQELSDIIDKDGNVIVKVGDPAIQEFFAKYHMRFTVPNGADFSMQIPPPLVNGTSIAGFTANPKQDWNDPSPLYEIDFSRSSEAFAEQSLSFGGSTFSPTTVGGHKAQLSSYEEQEDPVLIEKGYAPGFATCFIEDGTSTLSVSFQGSKNAYTEFKKFLQTIVFE